MKGVIWVFGNPISCKISKNWSRDLLEALNFFRRKVSQTQKTRYGGLFNLSQFCKSTKKWLAEEGTRTCNRITSVPSSGTGKALRSDEKKLSGVKVGIFCQKALTKKQPSVSANHFPKMQKSPPLKLFYVYFYLEKLSVESQKMEMFWKKIS